MKKWIIIALGVAALQTVQGHNTPQQPNQPDDWFAGVNLGLNTKTTHNRLLENLNGSASLRMGYELNPQFGFMAEGTVFFGDRKFGMSSCYIKAYNLDLLATYNLSYGIFGYPGYRRLFEAKLLLGIGNNYICGYRLSNNNDLIAKVGFDLGVNLGKHRQFYVYLQPALNYNLDHYSRTQFNLNYSAIQVAIGANYRFTWKNLFKKHRLDNQPQAAAPLTVDARVAEAAAVYEQPKKAVNEIAKLQPEEKKAATEQVKAAKKEAKEAAKKTKSTKNKRNKNKRDKTQRNKTRYTKNEPVKVEPVNVVPVTTETVKTEPVTTEPVNVEPVKTEPVKTEITPVQAAQKKEVAEKLARVDQVGVYMKSHPKSKVVIRGEEAQAKDAANQLARRFGISLTRIKVEATKATSVTFDMQ